MSNINEFRAAVANGQAAVFHVDMMETSPVELGFYNDMPNATVLRTHHKVSKDNFLSLSCTPNKGYTLSYLTKYTIVVCRNNDRYGIGISKRSPADKENRSIGNIIAYGRAVASLKRDYDDDYYMSSKIEHGVATSLSLIKKYLLTGSLVGRVGDIQDMCNCIVRASERLKPIEV